MLPAQVVVRHHTFLDDRGHERLRTVPTGRYGGVVEEVLAEDEHRPVVRVGDTVRRTMYPWSASVHLLLQHLESVGFGGAPRFLGIDDKGREVLSYVEGICGADGSEGPGFGA